MYKQHASVVTLDDFLALRIRTVHGWAQVCGLHFRLKQEKFSEDLVLLQLVLDGRLTAQDRRRLISRPFQGT